MFKLLGREISAILGAQTILISTYVNTHNIGCVDAIIKLVLCSLFKMLYLWSIEIDCAMNESCY